MLKTVNLFSFHVPESRDQKHPEVKENSYQKPSCNTMALVAKVCSGHSHHVNILVFCASDTNHVPGINCTEHTDPRTWNGANDTLYVVF